MNWKEKSYLSYFQSRTGEPSHLTDIPNHEEPSGAKHIQEPRTVRRHTNLCLCLSRRVYTREMAATHTDVHIHGLVKI